MLDKLEIDGIVSYTFGKIQIEKIIRNYFHKNYGEGFLDKIKPEKYQYTLIDKRFNPNDNGSNGGYES